MALICASIFGFVLGCLILRKGVGGGAAGEGVASLILGPCFIKLRLVGRRKGKGEILKEIGLGLRHGVRLSLLGPGPRCNAT